MVILRYVNREILKTTAAVTLVLLLVVLSGRLIQFLEKAANGELAVSLLLSMLVWRVPSSLELILPLALTLSVLLVLSRLNQDSELAVLRAAGVSEWRLTQATLVPVVVVALVVSVLSVWLSPHVARALDQQMVTQDRLTVFDTVVPGRFQSGRNGRLMYAESVSADRATLFDVFVVEPGGSGQPDVYLTGARARQEYVDGEKYLVLLDGFKHRGHSDRLDWEVSQFGRYVIRLEAETASRPDPLDAQSTWSLLETGTDAALAIVSFRVSLPVMCLLMLPFAVSLGQGSPRRSRFLWVIPVILVQFAYLSALSLAEGAITRGQLSPWPGLLWIHGVMALVGAAVAWGVPRLTHRGWL